MMEKKPKHLFSRFLLQNGGHIGLHDSQQGTYFKTVPSNVEKNCTHIEDV